MQAAPFARILGLLILLAALAGGVYAGWRGLDHRPHDIQYRLAQVERGTIAAVVTANGTVTAMSTVPVGPATAGRVSAFYADFNSEVRRNQVLARLDPEAFEFRLARARANLNAARTALADARHALAGAHAGIARERVASLAAQRDLEQPRTPVERGLAAPLDGDKAAAQYDRAQEQIRAAEAQLAMHEAEVDHARATVRQREANLALAQADLDRTYVRAPVDGTIISRHGDIGQTVAAGAPLFTIATDMREMQVDATIDEADIGRLRVGQAATFTVDAFPRRSFEGRVAQIRKAPQVAQNPVTYTVVVSAPNPDLALLPGMTARVRVVTASREDVLKVPNAALRFRPESAEGARSTPAAAQSSANGAGFIWQLDTGGNAVAVEVRVGASDGATTEVSGEGVSLGAAVVIGIATAVGASAPSYNGRSDSSSR